MLSAWRPQGIATTIHDEEHEHRRLGVAIPCGRYALAHDSLCDHSQPLGKARHLLSEQRNLGKIAAERIHGLYLLGLASSFVCESQPL